MFNDKKLSEIEFLFLALADKTRLRLLNLMRNGEVCVGSLVEALNESQPKISRHLAYLRNAGIVEAQRDGKWIYYKIIEPDDKFAAGLLRETLVWLEEQEQMQSEYLKLTAIYNSVNNPNFIRQKIEPDTFAQSNMNRKTNSQLETFLL